MKHGEARNGRTSFEYRVWGLMIQRCTNPGATGFHNYGGRGIRVCEEWRRSFKAFLADVGRRPAPGMSIDRIDDSGDYEPGNVRWATAEEQARNTRRNRWLTVGGETLVLTDWARRLGVKPEMIMKRLSRGWTPERAISEPPVPLTGPRTRVVGRAA